MSCFCNKSFCHKQLLDEVFLTSGIIKVVVSIISRTEGCLARLTTLAETCRDLILDITETQI